MYETGGLLMDHGWLRVLGPGWYGERGRGFLLVAVVLRGGARGR
jgi:hypothetical protein